MEPQIRYVRSADGTRIAYASTGAGPPVVCAQNPDGLVSVEIEWKVPRSRRAIEEISRSRRLIRIEARGRGLSDRETEDGSFEAHLSDTVAVIEAVGERVDLVGGSGGALSGMLAIAYAAANPQRVRTLALFGVVARARARGSFPPLRRAIHRIEELDFAFSKKVMALRAFGWDDGRIVAEAIEPVSREELDFGRRGWIDADVSDRLEQVNCPVLVGHLRASGADLAPMSASRHLASALVHAQLRVVDVNLPSIFDDEGTAVEALLSFLAEASAAPDEASSRGTAVILFADIADSTELTERMGDAAFRERARELDAAMRAAVTDNGGKTIDAKTLGDGILATFAAASQAVAAGLACAAAGDAQGLPVHVGLHAGDVIREDDPGGQSNVYGGAVNIAARISALSAAGEVLVSRTVADLARTSAGVVFEDRGEFALKGIEQAVRVYAVRAKGDR